MRQLIKQLPREFDMTVLISSHLLTEIDQIATTVGIVSQGKMIFQDSIEAMRNHAKPKIALKVGNIAHAHRALLSRGMKVEVQEEVIHLQEHSDEKIAQAIRFLVQDGISIYRVEEEKQSLEDIFLQMTTEGQ